MSALLAAAGLCAAILALYVYCYGVRVSPDGRKYLGLAQGEPQPLPFHLRFLLPKILGENAIAWQAVTMVSLLGTCVAVTAIALQLGASDVQAVAAGALFAGLPIVRTCVNLPILVDGPALLLTALGVLGAVHGRIEWAVVCALLGAAIKETVPIFIAAATVSTLPLVGLVIPVTRFALFDRGEAKEPCTATPIKYARENQGRRLLDVRYSLLPWGLCMAAFLAPTWPVLLSLAVGMIFLMLASDSTRVYQFAAIPICVAAATVIPENYLIPAVVLHLLNPWQGDL